MKNIINITIHLKKINYFIQACKQHCNLCTEPEFCQQCLYGKLFNNKTQSCDCPLNKFFNFTSLSCQSNVFFLQQNIRLKKTDPTLIYICTFNTNRLPRELPSLQHFRPMRSVQEWSGSGRAGVLRVQGKEFHRSE